LAFDIENAYAKDPFKSCSLEGCVLLVRRGGGVPFSQKVSNAQLGGAVGAIIINTHDYTEEYSLGHAENPLPSMLVGRTDGEAIIEFISANAASSDSGSAARTCCVVEVRTDVEHEVAVCKHLPPHPHLLQILDTWDEGDTPVVVCELCSGGKIMRPSTNCGVGTALWLLKQMLAGVAHLHRHGVCHRDIKPDNLLMTRPIGDPLCRLVIIDFSMSALTRSMTAPCGSARFLAPEVIAGRYGTPRDVWAVGVVAYELLWGAHPFCNADIADSVAIQAICAPTAIAVPPSRVASDVPAAACDLMRGLLQRDPALRLTADEALGHFALKDISLPECP
jgi:calcium/calmodulin-dependent protein kinase (CaM kinase) II